MAEDKIKYDWQNERVKFKIKTPDYIVNVLIPPRYIMELCTW